MSDSGLASSSALRPYPPRLHKQGKSPIQTHSMNHYSAMANLAKVREELGADVWYHLKNSCIGMFAKFGDLDYTWAAKRAHYLLVNQLLVDDPHEIWSVVDDRPIRFSLHEFGTFTGLNCDAIPSDVYSVSHEEFWREMQISTATGPTFEELELVMARSHLWDFNKRLMVAQLSLLSVAVLCIHRGSRIPLDIAKLVLDQKAFEKHPWGRVSFEKLITSIKIMRLEKKSYSLQGHVQVLLTWLYNHVHGIGEAYGKKRVKANETDTDEVPHLTWHSGRGGICFDKFITKEKAAHGIVRVTHMVEDIYPKWSDAEKIDPLVKNMVEDISSGTLRANAWFEDEKNNKRKIDVEDKKDDAELSKKKKKINGKEHGEAMFTMVEKVTGDVDAIKYLVGDLAKKVEANEKNNQKTAEQQKEIADMYSKVKSLLEVADTKEKNVQVQHEEDVHSNREVDDAVSSSTPSWMVELNQTSNNDFPSSRVVKKVKEKEVKKKVKERNEAEMKEKKEKEIEKKETEHGKKEKKQMDFQKKGKTEKKDEIKDKKEHESEDKEKKVEENEDKEKKVQETEKKEKEGKKAEKTKKKYEKKKKVEVKIEKTDAGDEKKAEACDEESIWSNPKDQVANKAMDKAIDGLLNLTTNLDVGTSKPRREIKLAGSQKFPFVGNSTVKRIIKGIQVSPNHYDPFDVVDEFLHEKLMEFVNVDDEEARLAKTRQFYLQIITPRDDWISSDYGWLASGHMYVAMTMFRNRHLSPPSPYCSQRIAFLDPFFMRHIQYDYPVYLAQGKNFVFRKTYRDNLFGLQPLVTNKRWFIDIDHLYGCLFVGTNHWVAIDVDFVKKTIFIYDSIPPEDDEKLQESVRPIRKMIPAILSEYIPATERKKSCAMMDVKRMLTNVPVNENPGDCGVYTLKYIECLALGLKFDGLSDKIIHDLRVKLASDIYAEAHYEVSDGLFDEYCLRKDVVPELIDEDVSEDELEEL